MRLDQLPNELIARIGSFLSFKDNIQFGLSQKRIHAVLRRDGLLKPECKELLFNTFDQPNCHVTLPDWTMCPIEEQTRDPKFNSFVGQVINKFRKIEDISFRNFGEKMTEDVLKDLLKTKTKLSSLGITFCNVDGDPNIFIAACKKFDKIYLRTSILSPRLLCDQVFVALMPIMRLSMDLMEFGFCPFDGCLLTDRTLEALTLSKVNFKIDAVLTSFTTAGIKNLVEEMAKSEATGIFSKNLGILKFSEEGNVRRWKEEADADPSCPYKFRSFGVVKGMNTYMIGLKDNTRRNMSIEFAINPVEV